MSQRTEQSSPTSSSEKPVPVGRERYALSSWLFLRLLGLMYLIAFVSIRVQLAGLFGPNGLVPLNERIQRLRAQSVLDFWDIPSLAWWTGGDLTLICLLGIVSSLTLAAGLVPKVAVFACWLLYLSVVAIGDPFMSFQWDALLLESGFTALLVAPLTAYSLPHTARTPWRVGRWLLYWLLFRVMFSSGVVKLASGDEAWWDLTALTYHYETQPLPHVFGWWAHHLPNPIHIASTGATFALELIVPFLIFWPGRVRRAAALSLIVFQLLIAATGNYGFFNLLTIALCIPLFDDASLRRVIPSRWKTTVNGSGRAALPVSLEPSWKRFPAIGVAMLIALLSTAQLTATVFRVRLPGMFGDAISSAGSFHTFNRYGLFAVMTTKRPEIIIEGSRDGRTWKQYDFRWKPDDLQEPPHFCSPHMPRLDWQMWFAALGHVRQNRWVIRLMQRLLENEPAVLGLLQKNPFPHEPPRYIRAVRYQYHFTDPDTLFRTGNWWRRERDGRYAPTLHRRR